MSALQMTAMDVEFGGRVEMCDWHSRCDFARNDTPFTPDQTYPNDYLQGSRKDEGWGAWAFRSLDGRWVRKDGSPLGIAFHNCCRAVRAKMSGAEISWFLGLS